MKRHAMTTAMLLAAFAMPSLAQTQPDHEGPLVIKRVVVDADQHKPFELDMLDLETSRAMTPEELERWAPIIQQLQQDAFGIEQPEVKPREMVRGPFLGVNAKPLDLETAKALGLKRSTGLLVSYVAGGGPASDAGLKKGDVLTKLGDQVLVNAEQFAVLVRSQKIGDTVTLHGLREGEPIKLEAKLGEADFAPLGPGGRDLDQAWRVQLNPLQGPIGNPHHPEVEVAPGVWLGDGWGEMRRMELKPGDLPENMREMIKKIEKRMLQQHQDMDARMKQLRQQLDLDIEQLRDGIEIPQGDGRVQQQLQATMMWSDGEHTIRISNKNGVGQLNIKDKEGKVLYDGPMPEAGPIEGLPADVQEKVDQLRNNTRIDLRVEPKAPQQPIEEEAPPRA